MVKGGHGPYTGIHAAQAGSGAGNWSEKGFGSLKGAPLDKMTYI